MSIEKPPTRLVEMPGVAGDCVRSALGEPPLLAETAPFNALRERRQRRAQRQLALSVAGAAALLLVGVRSLRHDDETLSVRAELMSAAASSPAPTPPAPPLEQAPSPVTSVEPVARATKPALARAAALPVRAITAAEPPTTNGSARACAELSRSGDAEQALACYGKLARGTGITAELALFEQARLQGKALRRPELALETLDDYRRRFPNGSLRAEVLLARIDWLLSGGQREQALQAVQEALASGLLRERAAELERLQSSLASAAPSPPR